MNNTPIVLFTYGRLTHTRLTAEALLCNHNTSNHDLIVFSDAARSAEQKMAVDQVRAYLATIVWIKSIRIHHRPHNFGLSKSIIDGVSEVLYDFERIIVLEDDLVTSPYFLTYMTDALERHAENERVICVHGYAYPVERTVPEAFFIRGADCWGWATWRRGWRLFNPDGQSLLKGLQENGLLRAFDFNGAYRSLRC